VNRALRLDSAIPPRIVGWCAESKAIQRVQGRLQTLLSQVEQRKTRLGKRDGVPKRPFTPGGRAKVKKDENRDPTGAKRQKDPDSAGKETRDALSKYAVCLGRGEPGMREKNPKGQRLAQISGHGQGRKARKGRKGQRTRGGYPSAGGERNLNSNKKRQE